MSDNDYEEDDEFYDEDEGDCLLRDEGLYGEMFARGHEYTALCDNCIGMIFGRQAPDPDVTSVVSDANKKPSSSRKSTRSLQGKNSTTKSIKTRAVRRQCSICQARTDWYLVLHRLQTIPMQSFTKSKSE